MTGGKRQGTIYEPTILADVAPADARQLRRAVRPGRRRHAVARRSTKRFAWPTARNYGFSASIFTRDIDRAMRFAREVDSGNLHINWGTQWRADMMPYGGLKDSGLGKEGPKYAIREMSEEKMVVFHLNS